MKTCEICGSEFESRRGYRCYYCNIKLRRFRVKLAAVKYKGGKCEHCGWVGPIEGYDFHHRDPSTKKFTISDRGTMYAWDRVVKELDKCDLLCRTCHALHHSTRNEELNKFVLDYAGNLDIELPDIYLSLGV